MLKGRQHVIPIVSMELTASVSDAIFVSGIESKEGGLGPNTVSGRKRTPSRLNTALAVDTFGLRGIERLGGPQSGMRNTSFSKAAAALFVVRLQQVASAFALTTITPPRQHEDCSACDATPGLEAFGTAPISFLAPLHI
mgnify:FL=1